MKKAANGERVGEGHGSLLDNRGGERNSRGGGACQGSNQDAIRGSLG